MSDWKRLGDLLVRRRVDLGFHNRSEFARQLGLKHQRTLIDIENGKRDNYERATLAYIEHAYRWRPGSIERVLAGGEPVPQDDGRNGPHTIDLGQLDDGSKILFTYYGDLTDDDKKAAREYVEFLWRKRNAERHGLDAPQGPGSPE